MVINTDKKIIHDWFIKHSLNFDKFYESLNEDKQTLFLYKIWLDGRKLRPLVALISSLEKDGRFYGAERIE